MKYVISCNKVCIGARLPNNSLRIVKIVKYICCIYGENDTTAKPLTSIYRALPFTGGEYFPPNMCKLQRNLQHGKWRFNCVIIL